MVCPDGNPLFHYVLLEAESDLGAEGQHLGPLGAHLVAQVLVGIGCGDSTSYCRQYPTWSPAREGLFADDFQLLDVVKAAGLAASPDDFPHLLTHGRPPSDDDQSFSAGAGGNG